MESDVLGTVRVPVSEGKRGPPVPGSHQSTLPHEIADDPRRFAKLRTNQLDISRRPQPLPVLLNIHGHCTERLMPSV